MAQDSIYVVVNEEDFYFCADTSIVDEFVASRYQGQPDVSYISMEDAELDSEQLWMIGGKYKHKIWRLKAKSTEKMKKVDKAKVRKTKKKKRND